jgi:hypothetical protein
MDVYYITPPVDIEQPLSINVLAVKDVVFTTRVTGWAHPGCLLDASLLAQHPVQYAWSLQKVGNSSILASSAGTVTSFGISAALLEPLSSYQLKLATSYLGYNLSTHTTTVSINVQPAPMLVSIREGPVYHLNLQQTSMSLHAEVSDRDQASKTFNWVLSDKNGNTAWSGNGSAIASIPTMGLSNDNAPYSIVLSVSKFGLSPLTTNATVTVTTAVLPSVSVSGHLSVSTSKPLSMQAQASLLGASCTGCTVQWSSSQITASQLLAYSRGGTSSLVLVIRPNRLTPGTYTFTCTVTSAAGVTGSSAVDVTVTSPPSIGGVSAQVTTSSVGFDTQVATYGPFPANVTGIFYQTKFTIGAINISTTSSTLSYQFGYIRLPSTRITWLGPPSSATTYETQKLPAGTLYPVARIAEGYGSSQIWITAVSTYPIIIAMPSAADGDVATYLSNQATSLLAAAAGDPSAQMGVVGALAGSLSQATNNSAAARSASRALRKKLAASLSSSAASASVDPTAVMGLALSLTSGDPTLLSQDTQTAIQSALTQSLARSSSLSSSDAVSAFTALQNVQTASGTLGLNASAKISQASQYKSVLRTVHTKVAAAMVSGEDAVEISSTNSSRTFVYKHTSTGIVNQTVGKCKLRSSAGLPLTVVGSGTAVSAAANTNYAADNTTVTHHIHGLTMMDESGSVVKLTNTSATCNPPDNAPVYPVCKFYNETTNLWETTGTTYNAVTGECDSTHLTDFSQFQGPAPPTPPTPPATSNTSNTSSTSIPTTPSSSSASLRPLWILLGTLSGVVILGGLYVASSCLSQPPPPEPKKVEAPPEVKVAIPPMPKQVDIPQSNACC